MTRMGVHAKATGVFKNVSEHFCRDLIHIIFSNCSTNETLKTICQQITSLFCYSFSDDFEFPPTYSYLVLRIYKLL